MKIKRKDIKFVGFKKPVYTISTDCLTALQLYIDDIENMKLGKRNAMLFKLPFYGDKPSIMIYQTKNQIVVKELRKWQ